MAALRGCFVNVIYRDDKRREREREREREQEREREREATADGAAEFGHIIASILALAGINVGAHFHIAPPRELADFDQSDR